MISAADIVGCFYLNKSHQRLPEFIHSGVAQRRRRRKGWHKYFWRWPLVTTRVGARLGLSNYSAEMAPAAIANI
jgi:hypothetical protein